MPRIIVHILRAAIVHTKPQLLQWFRTCFSGGRNLSTISFLQVLFFGPNSYIHLNNTTIGFSLEDEKFHNKYMYYINFKFRSTIIRYQTCFILYSCYLWSEVSWSILSRSQLLTLPRRILQQKGSQLQLFQMNCFGSIGLNQSFY